MREQTVYRFLVVFLKYHDDHQVSGACIPDDEVTQQSFPAFDIVKGQTFFACIGFGYKSDIVGRVLLQVTGFYVQNLVKHSRKMKTKAVIVIVVHPSTQLSFSAPSPV